MANSNVRVLNALSSAKLREMSDNNAIYTGFLKFQGRVFKQSAAVALEFYTQKPDTRFIANANQWAAAGYKIKDGGEAIHFTYGNGNRHDLFDFSQVDGNYAPSIWMINAENAGQFKTALGISQDAPIIKSVIEQTVKKSSVIDCMEALGVPPQMFESFKNTYIGAVQTIIAGRFEIGGNQFSVTPDMSAFKALSEPQKMHFLTMVSNAARASLMQVEKIANEIANQNQERGVENEKNNVSAVGKSHGGAAEQSAGGLSAGNPAIRTGEQVNPVENDTERRSEVLGNTVRGRTNDDDLSRIQA